MKSHKFITFLGVEPAAVSHVEKLVSGLGAFVAILGAYIVSDYFLGDDAFLLVASMGAATVLLFAVPHGLLSQPWPLIGGNLISALIGVSCYQLIPDLYIASAAAVSISVTVMYYLKCVHPPGGATALIAVVGGEAVHELSYMYVITPVLLNVLVMFLVAFLFNYLFKWRRYPVSLMERDKKVVSDEIFSRDAIAYGIKELDSFVDVTEEDINRICKLAKAYQADKRQTYQL
ncbi:MAG: HPP family protein [Ghiorsea sp.]